MKRIKHDISAIISDAVSRAQTPCAAVLLKHHDEETLFQMGGFANLLENKPITRNAIYRLYSLTKPMTAVAAMTLIERGKLDILSPVSEYLDGFQDQQVAISDTELVPVKRPVQIRDLFTMTSGLPYPGETLPAERAITAMYERMEAETMQGLPLSTIDMANRIGRCPLAHQPGERWMYGTSADILGAVIEIVSGKPLNEYMHEILFAPLVMKDTGFFVSDKKQDRLVTLYEQKDDTLHIHPDHETRHGVFSLPCVLEGGAGVFSTIDDVMTFGQMLLKGGKLNKERILSQNAVAWLTENHLTPQQQSYMNWDSLLGYGYGGLMRMLLSPGQSCSLGVQGEYGWDGWTGTYMTVCPDKKLVLVVMQQLAGAGTNALIRKIRNVVYASI